MLVLGDLASKNMADWYSGKPPYATTLLSAIKKILKGRKVDAMEFNDLCCIYNSKEEGWLRVDGKGKVAFDGDEDTRTVFEEIDYGFNAVSYRYNKTNKYLNLTSDLELACDSDDVWGWFTMEQFFRDEETGKFLPHASSFFEFYKEQECETINKLTSPLRREIITNTIAPIVRVAEMSDTVLMVLGNHPLINGRECFDRPSIEFPERWKQLIRSVHEVNKNTILVLISGYPYAFPQEEKLARAVLYTAHGEQEVGTAVAETLFGRYNPAGRLSMTWYLSEDDLPAMDDYDIIESPRTYMYFDKPVLYPFGHGLSYTAFSYYMFKVVKHDEGFTVTCEIKNTGDTSGDEVAQLYATFNDAPVKVPLLKLCGFERVSLAAEESKTVTFEVPAEELMLYSESEAAFTIKPKSVTFAIGTSSADIRIRSKQAL